jgi:hypothetical protein
MRSRGKKRRTSLEGIGIRNSRMRRSNWRTAQLGVPGSTIYKGLLTLVSPLPSVR